MTTKDNPPTKPKAPPGDGERTAQRGYVTQYDLTSRVVYEALARNQLQWLGVADRGAGTFDDAVLGLSDRIAAYQIKTSRDPERFRIRTLLLGAPKLLERFLNARRILEAEFPGKVVETVYACDDYPATDDDIGDPRTIGISSAAFLRTHAERRLTWSLADWRASEHGTFIDELIAASGVADATFLSGWRYTRFETAGAGRGLGLNTPSPADSNRLKQLAAELPLLVTEPAHSDRWTVEELLRRLRWNHPFQLRHSHVFPVDAFHESNATTESALQTVLANTRQGYISLVGPPGTGKSTLLASGLLPTPSAIVVRYLAYVPGEGQGLGRGEAFDFLYDLVAGLKRHGRGSQLVTGSDLPELRSQLEQQFAEASEVFRADGLRTVIVIDGLDHVPREERPQRSFLRELPLPQAIPEGVVFVLGTQRLDLADMPPAVFEQAGESSRSITVAPLTREAVARLAAASMLPADVSRDLLYARTEGHPLSTRYAIAALASALDEDARSAWLTDGPAYAGDIEAFYRRAWRDIEGNDLAKKVMAYVALAEGSIHPNRLDELTSCSAVDVAWKAASHLLSLDRRGAWIAFHNSFRLFLRSKANERFGRPAPELLNQRYHEMATMAGNAPLDDPQHWLELRYRARAADHDTVLRLATVDRFREQFKAGRSTRDISSDIRLALIAARDRKSCNALIILLLAQHELSHRTESIGDEILMALIATEDLATAEALLDAPHTLISQDTGYYLVDAYLEAGDGVSARRVFEHLENIDVLLGEKECEQDPDQELEAWARRALAFRDAAQLRASLARLRLSSTRLGSPDIETFSQNLKLTAAFGAIERDPIQSILALKEMLELPDECLGYLYVYAAQCSARRNDPVQTLSRLKQAERYLNFIDNEARREAAHLAALYNRLELAGSFITDVEPPSLYSAQEGSSLDSFNEPAREIFVHAAVRECLGLPAEAGATPKGAIVLRFQQRLEALGRIAGAALGGRKPPTDPITDCRTMLEFLRHAESSPVMSGDKMRLDKVSHTVVKLIAEIARVFGGTECGTITKLVDDHLSGPPSRLTTNKVRRAFALACFRTDLDGDAADKRIAFRIGLENTPSEELAEIGKTASAYAAIGNFEKARELLNALHDQGLGYSRPPKKDPQYIVWREMFERANLEDPAGRGERIRFLGKLLSGMAETEGRYAARRLAISFVTEAIREGEGWSRSALDLLEGCDLAGWAELVSGVAIGTVKEAPELALVAGEIFGRLALPFYRRDDKITYTDLINVSPISQIKELTIRSINCIESVSDSEERIFLLNTVTDSANSRGIFLGEQAIDRWKSELPPPRSGSSPEDPFFLLRDFTAIHEIYSRLDDTFLRYGVRDAFDRLALSRNYAEARALFDIVPELQEAASSTEIMVRLANSEANHPAAAGHLAALKKMAENRGSWGGWSGDAKFHYYRAIVCLEGETAREAAFSAFLGDLIAGLVNFDSLPHYLVDVLELLSPYPCWIEAWNSLTEVLRQFREYRSASEFEKKNNVAESAIEILADLLMKALETGSVPLAHATRSLAVEIMDLPGGSGVVGRLLPLLLAAGGELALVGSQIAWECGETLGKDSMAAVLRSLCDSDDIAVRRVGFSLADRWGVIVPRPINPLSPLYFLEFPHTPEAGIFEPPSGMTATASGLYTEDPYAWTWPLEHALKMTARASGLPLINLRHRVATVMGRQGGTAVFGPDASKMQSGRLRRLRLETSYKKLMNVAAFYAMRVVVGELEAAEAIDPEAIPQIIVLSGGFAMCVRAELPIARPIGIAAPSLPVRFTVAEIDAWLESAEADLQVPMISGWDIVASVAHHQRDERNLTLVTDQYFGPAVDVAENVIEQLQALPWLFVDELVRPLYPNPAPGLVAWPRQIIAGSYDLRSLVLCPRIAKELRWQRDRKNPFVYRDDAQTIVAQTISWRDGGELASFANHSTRRQGKAVVVRPDWSKKLFERLRVSRISLAWRSRQSDDQIVRSVKASRIVHSAHI